MIPYSNSPFERTICDCAPCCEHCHEQPGTCAPGDYERIAMFLGKSPSEVAHLFVSSPGATVHDRRTGETRFVQTITPATVPGSGGRCVFLDKDNRCSIHPVSPFGCAAFDNHLSPRETDRRSTWVIHAIQKSLTYGILRESLPFASVYNPRNTDPVRNRLVTLTDPVETPPSKADAFERLACMILREILTQ